MKDSRQREHKELYPFKYNWTNETKNSNCYAAEIRKTATEENTIRGDDLPSNGTKSFTNKEKCKGEPMINRSVQTDYVMKWQLNGFEQRLIDSLNINSHDHCLKSKEVNRIEKCSCTRLGNSNEFRGSNIHYSKHKSGRLSTHIKRVPSNPKSVQEIQ